MNLSLRFALPVMMGAAFLHPMAAHGSDRNGQKPDAYPSPTPLAANQYLVTNLTANSSAGAPTADPNLVNPWGLSRSSGGPWWVSDNGTGLSTLYTGAGSVIPLVVTIPPAKAGSGNLGSPTGTIYNGTSNFAIAPGSPAVFLFATEDGTISGWNPGVNPGSAVIAVNESANGASFKGLTSATLAAPGAGPQTLLYAANFTGGKVEVFDGAFNHIEAIERNFNGDDDRDEGFSPFNVQNLGGNIYVTYAKPGAGNNETDGPGLGQVLIFSPEGRLLKRLQHGDWFNAPWGIAIAPSDFGAYSHSILVANFGNGWIAAFDPITGKFQDYLRDSSGNLLWIPGIWAISPGNGAKAGNATSLYFAAGGSSETSGVLGNITATQNPQGNAQ